MSRGGEFKASLVLVGVRHDWSIRGMRAAWECREMFKILNGQTSLTMDGYMPWGLDPKWYEAEIGVNREA